MLVKSKQTDHGCLYGKYGHLSASEISYLTQTKEVCPEWQNPHAPYTPIKFSDVLLNYGKSQAESEAIVQSINDQLAYENLISDMV